MGAHCFDCHPPPCTHARPPAFRELWLRHFWCLVSAALVPRVRDDDCACSHGERVHTLDSLQRRCEIRHFLSFASSMLQTFPNNHIPACTHTRTRVHIHHTRFAAPPPRCRGFIHTHTHTSTTRATCSDEAFVSQPPRLDSDNFTQLTEVGAMSQCHFGAS